MSIGDLIVGFVALAMILFFTPLIYRSMVKEYFHRRRVRKNEFERVKQRDLNNDGGSFSSPETSIDSNEAKIDSLLGVPLASAEGYPDANDSQLFLSNSSAVVDSPYAVGTNAVASGTDAICRWDSVKSGSFFSEIEGEDSMSILFWHDFSSKRLNKLKQFAGAFDVAVEVKVTGFVFKAFTVKLTGKEYYLDVMRQRFKTGMFD